MKSNDSTAGKDANPHIDDRSKDEELSPHKEEEPNLIGRVRWFRQRAGVRSNSISITRLSEATELAATTPLDPRDSIFSDSLRAAYKDFFSSEKGDALLQDSYLNIHAVGTRDNLQDRAFGAFGPVLTIREVTPPFAVLALRVSPQNSPDLDFETAAFSYWQSDEGEVSIIEASKFSSQDGLLIGRITQPGFCQAIALPRDPLTDRALKLISSHLQELRFSGLFSARENAANKKQHFLDALRTLSDSVAQPFAAFIGPMIERFAEEDSEKWKEPEPPLLKLWRILQLKKAIWARLGPFQGPHVESIGRITQLDTHPENSDTVVAASAGGGVWRTDDSGSQWYSLMEEQPTLTMGAVAFAPSAPEFIYAASGEDAGDFDLGWPGAGVYRSTDGGKNWALTDRVSSDRFSAIVVNPRTPYTLYVAGNRGLHKSTDGGQSWILADGQRSLYDGQVTDVVLDYEEPERVYIGVRNRGVLRSLTGGESRNQGLAFRLLSDPLPTDKGAGWVKLAVGRRGVNSKVVVAKLGPEGRRIFVTEDGGDVWKEKATAGASEELTEWTSVIAVDPFDSSKLYAGASSDKLAFSVNKGDSWDDLPISVFEDQQDVAFDNKNSNRIFLANDGGVSRISLSSGGGATLMFASGNLSVSQLYDLDICEVHEEVVACGAQDTGFYYRNSGGEWRQIGKEDVTQVAVDPANPDIFYFAGPNETESVTLLHSKDGGRTLDTRSSIDLQEPEPWVPIIKLHPDPGIDDPDNTRKMFLCGSRTFFFSSNAGRCFRRVDYKSGRRFRVEGEITALEYAPGDPSILYLGTSQGALYKARGGGGFADDWTALKRAFSKSPIAAIAVDWRSPDDVWIVLAGNGVSRVSRPRQAGPIGIAPHVFKTSDGGRQWANASGAIIGMQLPDVPMSAIALDPFDRNVAYVGTDVGVFRTSDGGVSWLAFQEGLPRSPVTELRLNRRQRILFAATMGRGVYRRSLD